MVRLHIQGVPIHPAVVHFPIVFWTVVPVAQLAYLVVADVWMWQVAYWSTLAGIAFGMVAAATGVLDFADQKTIPRGGRAFDLAQSHLRWMAATWCCFALQLAVTLPKPPAQASLVLAFTLSVAGIACMVCGGHQAGRLVHSNDGIKSERRDSHAK